MSFLKKIKEHFNVNKEDERLENVLQPNKKIKHEFVNFSNAYRIGLLGFYKNPDDLNIIAEYKKKLDSLGYESEILVYVDKAEKDPHVFVPHFDWNDLDKNLIPNSPRPDRFVVRRFDILMNLYFENNPQLLHISNQSNARCRVAPFLNHFQHFSDVMIPLNENPTLSSLIETINTILNIKPYERKEI